MEDVHRVGGTPAVLKYLLAEGLLDGSCMTVTGKTLAENVANVPDLEQGQDVIMPLSKPIKASGHLQILYGNLAPEGSVAKITGKEGLSFEGSALCFDCEEDMLKVRRRAAAPGAARAHAARAHSHPRPPPRRLALARACGRVPRA